MWYFILNVFFYFSIFFTKASWLVVLGLKFLWCLVCRSLFDLFHFRKFAYRAFCYLNNANIGPIFAKNHFLPVDNTSFHQRIKLYTKNDLPINALAPARNGPRRELVACHFWFKYHRIGLQ